MTAGSQHVRLTPDSGHRFTSLEPAQAYPPKEKEEPIWDTIIRSELDKITQSRYKGKLTGAKPPLRPKHFWAVRTRLQLANRLRDLALFDLAIDSKLRGCDVVALKVVDVAAFARGKSRGGDELRWNPDPPHNQSGRHCRDGWSRPREYKSDLERVGAEEAGDQIVGLLSKR
jgi:hypothetical protein